MMIWYMSGAGNTFVVCDARGQTLDFSALAKKLCAMRKADGFMALTEDKVADFRLNYYNADGSRAAMCGNGARCICRFAYETRVAGPEMTLQTDGGPIFGQRRHANQYRVRLNDPSGLELGEISRIEYGVPHAVVELPDLEFSMRPRLLRQARKLRRELDANVDFFVATGPTTARVLTYERGVERFTAACGTGCAAVASVLQAQERLQGTLLADNRGGQLVVTLTSSGTYLTGSAEVLDIWDVPL